MINGIFPSLPLVVLTCTVFTVGCGDRARNVDDGSQESEQTAEPTLVAATHLGLELRAENSRAPFRITIDVVMTDETGSNSRHKIGEFDGPCTDVSATERSEGRPMLAARCEPDGARGALLHFVRSGDELVTLRDWLDDSDLAFDEIARVGLPAGSKITVK